MWQFAIIKSELATFSIVMKIFNGRAATEEYMSTHSLTFSTPEMTLKKFAIWLGDQVNMPGVKEEIPRLMLYIQEKDRMGKTLPNFMPDIDETFKPTGAVTEMYSKVSSTPNNDNSLPEGISSGQEKLKSDSRVCVSCGFNLKLNSRFCTKCGLKQV
jgi:hypothetical protein